MAVYDKNKLPHSALSTTLFEAFCGKRPSIGHFRAFEETSYAYIAAEARPVGTKLKSRAREIRICRYGGSSGIYRIYDPTKPQVFISGNDRFGNPLVGEDKRASNEDSYIDDNNFSDFDTTTEKKREEEEEGKEEAEEAGSEGLLEDGSQFIIDKVEKIPFLDESVLLK